jgi:superfamily II DNA or RNA helicase
MKRLAQNALPLDEPGQVALVPKDWLDTLPPKADCLRDYQRRLIASVAAKLREGHTRILLQLATGGGKTHIIAAIANAAGNAGLRVLTLATRTRLVWQIHERLDAFQIRHGIIAASLPQLRNFNAKVQVAGVDTLYRRTLMSGRAPLPAVDIVIFDEAHLATASSRLRILKSYPRAQWVGLTATPARKSGLPLSAAFDSLILGPSIQALTDAGVLVPARIFNTPIITQAELQALPKDADRDYKSATLGELLSRPKLVGDVVTNWFRIAHGKRTVCFATNKAHAAALLDSFRRQGVAVEMITDADDEETREEVLGRLETGNTTVLINCFLMSYGVDIPTIECIVLARPTRSLTMYLQMVGRGLRATPGKAHCILIDHGHVVENLGLPQSDHGWTLDDGRNVNSEALAGCDGKSSIEQTRTCGECAALWLTSECGNTCPECGWGAPLKSKSIAAEDADLQEITDDEDPVPISDLRVLNFYREACGWYARRWAGRWAAKQGSGRWWAWNQTRAKFEIAESAPKPSNFWNASPAKASIETDGWLRHRLIKWARSKATTA